MEEDIDIDPDLFTPPGNVTFEPAKPTMAQQLNHHKTAPWVEDGSGNRNVLAPARSVNSSGRLSLSGYGFSPYFADMHVTLTQKGVTQTLPVLAATANHLELAPTSAFQPGPATLSVTNLATGQSTEPRDLFLYDMQGRLVRTTLHTGHDQTQLIVTVQPEDVPMPVQARVVSGPVDFGGGRKEAQATTSGGRSVFPESAERGAGPFEIDWSIAPRPDGFSPVSQDEKTRHERK